MTKTCIVIGGGITGLAAADMLNRYDITVRVIDKGRGIAGRLAARRFTAENSGEGVFDYGAQCCTAHEPLFRNALNEWRTNGIIDTWSDGFFCEDGTLKQDGITRYKGIKSMREIAKNLARGLKIRLSTRIDSIRFADGKWCVTTEFDSTCDADVLLLTPPLPQSLALLSDSGIRLPEEELGKLSSVEYDRCIALLALFDTPSSIPEPGGMWLSGEPLSWIADNSKKGISPECCAVTVHAGPEFSEHYWEKDDKEIAELMLAACNRWVGGNPLAFQVHRWRYSRPKNALGTGYYALRKPAPLLLAGDAFHSPRVEGGYMSGRTAADYILSII